MLRNTFIIYIVAISSYYLILIVIAALGYSFKPEEWQTATKFIKDFLALLTALPTAALAFAVQQRLTFIKELRDGYGKCVDAVEEAIFYCKSSQIDLKEKLRVLKGLSIAIEKVRGIYDDKGSTAYPVDDLKKIYDIIAYDNSGNLAEMGKKIEITWKSARQVFLTEIDRGGRKIN
ncbi:hypothetical protein [Deinococcus marmoris]|uniref:hypothetical protein n=1 Tax=Deinococcus marmoris TaxID=249408 RepID=UPI0012DEC981|nr:hypothetical protein [Deinococcus marmoris]